MQKLSIPDLSQFRINRKLVTVVGIPILAAGVLAAMFNEVFFYNEAGQMTHVRTIFGEEKVVEDVATPQNGLAAVQPGAVPSASNLPCAWTTRKTLAAAIRPSHWTICPSCFWAMSMRRQNSVPVSPAFG